MTRKKFSRAASKRSSVECARPEDQVVRSFVENITAGLQKLDSFQERIIAPEYVNDLSQRYRKTKSTPPAELVAFLEVFADLPSLILMMLTFCLTISEGHKQKTC